jgi:transposase InsO family protein
MAVTAQVECRHLAPTGAQPRCQGGLADTWLAGNPKHTPGLVQFACARFMQWCRRHGIRQRRGAVGQHGSIAVAERFIGTLKRCCLRALSVVPLRLEAFAVVEVFRHRRAGGSGLSPSRQDGPSTYRPKGRCCWLCCWLIRDDRALALLDAMEGKKRAVTLWDRARRFA